ncbi:MAG: cytochrome c oxidase accessory protein CcoG [Gammaproteobacteria bacterium]|nr:cytochrome c oxidase accessory protein CcoG [Gammaproteobacteria bacterium]
MEGTTGKPLYEAAEKIYPREIDGTYARLRIAGVLVLLGLYYGLAWLQWDGRQAVLFDLPARKFYIFDLVLFPQDFFFLSWLLIIAALSLFFFTALAGRLWCGYACPQTVWTEAFLWMERLAEGRGAARRKLDKAPWNGNKIRRKVAKQALWIGFALWTGFTFVGYFTPIRDLGIKVVTLSLGGWETFWVVFYGFATYGNAGYMREQVCKYMCPYARFQSAMFDRDSLIISYDESRGEPRGSRRRNADPKAAGLGDCIDCTMCVQVCPTGIDIRKGLQYECIACAACIDACDSVMDKMNYPRGLIRYSTQHAMEGVATRVLRPRVLVYGTFLAALCAAFVFALFTRVPLELDIIRDRNALYRDARPGYIENVYMLRVINKDEQPHAYEITVAGLPTVTLETDPAVIEVAAGEIATIAARVSVEDGAVASGGHDVEFSLQASDVPDLATTETNRFISP